jgi:hypothetical protein
VTRFTVPQACYSSAVVDGAIVSCRVGPHSADRAWPWWAPWDALEDVQSPMVDGRHPTLAWTPFARPAPAWPAGEAVQGTLPFPDDPRPCLQV